MDLFTALATVFTFLAAMAFILWRPNGLNEAVPALIGGLLMFAIGSVNLSDLADIAEHVSGAAITIIATMVMAIALQSFGFFHWITDKLQSYAKGSGIRLFWLINFLCFLMTLFFNNDGSILITTPILILLFKKIGLKKHEQIPYLISGAIIATASSAPIGVSNVVNLIALQMIGLDLYAQTEMMLIPCLAGLIFLALLLYAVLYKRIPKTLPDPHAKSPLHYRAHPLRDRHHEPKKMPPEQKRQRMMISVLLFVLVLRIGLFAASFWGIPIWIVAATGSAAILTWRYLVLKKSPLDVLKKTPWHIFVFAFSMYMMIYGLHHAGLTRLLATGLQPLLSENMMHSTIAMGALVTVLSNLFNNHPALMVSTLTITHMDLQPAHLQTAYMASIIGSDIGSLILPIGTLATLIWLHILKINHIKFHWREYIRITFVTILPTVLATLFLLYGWLRLFY
ncbi:putative arsenical pump membrane protein [Weizmannia acidilactici]|uniref:Arsenical pump membrane protein n=1 Tax=Weizmannia acidilactici TaxID=2607726 RepID=A0A5J4J278_9BACI|nr:arsenic transporter [Weizmannia acidilactici]GER69122.1 putative arsenical pump membrane protein [Weizmannia acidilactici]GER72180.1 putative arsenical pump membrane protein [Weizmannia acidilactici]